MDNPPHTLLNIHNSLHATLVNALDSTVCYSSEIACWLNGQGDGLGLVVGLRVC